MKYQKIFFAVSVFLLCTFGNGIYLDAKCENTIESNVSEFQNKTNCNSVNIVVYDDGKVSYYGNDKEDGLYQIGSMTKAFTGLGIMKLVREGKIVPEYEISAYLPGFEAYYEGEKVDITVAELLSQTSGFTNSERNYPSAKENMTLSEWVEQISGSELRYNPGEQYSYSNVNYNLLGAIIEKVSGISYKEYMEQEILIPLGLDHTYVGFLEDEENIVKGTRLGYWKAYHFDTVVREGAIPAGYFYSNIHDMCRWVEIWLDQADIPAVYKELIEETRDYLNHNSKYYAGWEYSDEGVIGHSGGTANYSSRIVFSNEENIGVCVLTNLNVAASTDRLCNDILAITAGKEPAGFSYDIWTIFDNIFSVITIIGSILLFVIITKFKRIRTMIVSDVAGIVILAASFVIMPAIFQSGWGEILFVWAPWSMLGGIIVLLLDVTALSIKIWRCKKHENHYKKS